jgi:hypothetical protein
VTRPLPFITERDVYEVQCLVHCANFVKPREVTQIIVADNLEEAIQAVRNGFPAFWWSEDRDCKDRLSIVGGKMVMQLNLEVEVSAEEGAGK